MLVYALKWMLKRFVVVVVKVSKGFSWRRFIFVNIILFASANGSADAAGWVIERDDRGESPLTKERKSLALSPEQELQQAYAQAYRRVLSEEKRKISEHWTHPEVSGPTRWVTYSNDYRIKRAVDFEFNRLEISLEGQYTQNRLDFSRTARQVETEVALMLATTLAQALKNDPINKALTNSHLQLAPEPEVANKAQRLVLSLLFDNVVPSATEINEQAAALMRNASIRYQAMTASLAAIPVSTTRKLTYVIPFPDSRIRRKVVEYDKVVAENAARFNVPQDVILAIIHTESHFNPLARSHVPAFGLMQIVPATAGRDAARKLYRKSKLFSPQYLYNPQQNIEIGAAYLNVLYFDYLKEIKNPESRLYYTIAAYNAGASSVARAFTGKASFTDAINVINSMTPQEVLHRLIEGAPSNETRQYVRHILKRRSLYAAR